MLQRLSTPSLRAIDPATLTPQAIAEYEIFDILAARDNFWHYRIVMNPRFVLFQKWFPRALARKLRAFWNDFKAGKRPILLLACPPQHGKSLSVIDFIAWAVGHDPELRVIYSSFSDRLGIRANLRLQRALASSTYARMFPQTRLGANNVVTLANRYLRNHEVLEFVEHEGYFRNTTVLGSITGEALDLCVIDDPMKGRAEANSLNQRDKVWSWLTDDVFSRFSEQGALLMIMCMVGDTAVLMADGTEKALKDIRPGDRIATYEGGGISSSMVRNWKDNGPDNVYEIRMSSGTTVKANERHPFLVVSGDGLVWVRLKNLKAGDQIVKVLLAGAVIAELPALSVDAKSKLYARDIAEHITPKSDGRRGIALHQSTPQRGEHPVSSIDTELQPANTMRFSPPKAEDARFAINRRGRTLEHIGAENCASIMSTGPEEYAGCYATTAISPSDTGRLRTFYSEPLDMCEIVHDTVIEIIEAGRENVFDIEVERTANFIASGLVSHNTRWHLDDPAGRLLEHFGERVSIVRYPAIAEEDEEFRKAGEPLFPEIKSLEFLEQRRSLYTQASWQALYQQTPIVAGGGLFPLEKVEVIPELPAAKDVVSVARYFDKAGTEAGGAYTAGVLMLRMRDGTFVVADVRRGQWSALDRERVIRQTVMSDHEIYPTVKVYVEQEPGSGGKKSAEATVRMLAGYSAQADRVTGAKEVRADPFAAQWQAGNVRIVAAPWNWAYLNEMETAPAGKYVDQMDASTGAFNKIASKYRYPADMSWVS